MIPFLGWIASVAVHPAQPLIICGDSTGDVNLIELAGLELGRLVVTAYQREGELRLRCPSCLTLFQVAESAPGKELACPKCARELWLNAFVLDRNRRLGPT
jgi:hypothetical protein